MFVSIGGSGSMVYICRVVRARRPVNHFGYHQTSITWPKDDDDDDDATELEFDYANTANPQVKGMH